MDQQQWQQIENILDQVWEIKDPKKQVKRVKNICEDNQQLCTKVIHLLKNIQKAEEEGFMENS